MKSRLVVESRLLAEYDSENQILVLWNDSSDQKYSVQMDDFINKNTTFHYLNSEQFGEYIWSMPNVVFKPERDSTLVLQDTVVLEWVEQPNGSMVCLYNDDTLDYLNYHRPQVSDFLKEIGLLETTDSTGYWKLMKLFIAHPQLVYKKSKGTHIYDPYK